MTGQSGLTLVEVLVAMLLIGIGLLAAAPMFVQAIEGNNQGAEFGTAGNLALQRMELLRADDYADLTPGGNLAVDTAGYVDTSNDGFVVRWLIQTNSTPANTKIVTVRALATNTGYGPQKEVTLTSLRSQ